MIFCFEVQLSFSDWVIQLHAFNHPATSAPVNPGYLCMVSFLPLQPRGNPWISRRSKNAKPLAFPSQCPHQGMVFLPGGVFGVSWDRWPYWWLEHYRTHLSHSAWFNVVLAFFFQSSSVGLPIKCFCFIKASGRDLDLKTKGKCWMETYYYYHKTVHSSPAIPQI